MKYLVMILMLAACAGPKGEIGQTGETGAKGDKGDTGNTGGRGNTGAPGSSCSVNFMPGSGGGALIRCGDGSSVFVHNGTDGINGIDGTNGTDGIDATPVQMIKLCPNIVGSYATNTFPEYAFQVGGALYGVYSANGNASLAQLYPGAYSTTAPGGNCSFTVNADGTVSH